MAYYSKAKPDVYHECRNCTVGNNIEKDNLTTGNPGGAILCKECADLQRQGKCKSGTPIAAE